MYLSLIQLFSPNSFFSSYFFSNSFSSRSLVSSCFSSVNSSSLFVSCLVTFMPTLIFFHGSSIRFFFSLLLWSYPSPHQKHQSQRSIWSCLQTPRSKCLRTRYLVTLGQPEETNLALVMVHGGEDPPVLGRVHLLHQTSDLCPHFTHLANDSTLTFFNNWGNKQTCVWM